MRAAAVAIVLALIGYMAMVEPAQALDPQGCDVGVSLDAATQSCAAPGGATVPTGDGHDYELVHGCLRGEGPTCSHAMVCVDENGYPGYLAPLLRDGEFVRNVCVSDGDPAAGQVTPGQMLTAFRRLKWPAGVLVIQPPNGRTLINFDTNFYSTSTEPQTQQVTLLGQRITIEATPSQYGWHFGDEAQLTTDTAGAPYPDLFVTHRYLRKGSYAPRLDLTYRGRYRVGAGPWQQIPGTHTVAGTAQRLEAGTAKPKLVNPYGG